MAASSTSSPNPNRFSFRNPFHFFISSSSTNTNNDDNSRPNSRPNSPISPGFWSSLYRKTSSTSTTTSNNMSDSSTTPPPLSISSSPATSVDSYFPSIVTPADNNTNLKPATTPCTCGSSTSSLSSSTSSLCPPAPPRRHVTAPVIHVQPPVPGRKQIRVDPLSTQFPAPVAEASLEEMLARKPGRWSLTHYVKNAKVVAEREVVVVDDAEKKRREMEEVKRELRRLASGL
ncbi:hypothetical protein QBC36DRAFT_49166 [Triangularia setosa]|uniref:Uncharacterized protein n=1 Tax=Triangularia setosa TaxID=2587417 RepID=A0AAN6W1Z7_9PEZI|nr:hypothetical protein QBC36DRAFT_49166 [Podospora setosa]